MVEKLWFPDINGGSPIIFILFIWNNHVNKINLNDFIYNIYIIIYDLDNHLSSINASHCSRVWLSHCWTVHLE